MAVKRIWFTNAPGGTILLQSYQIGIGYPLSLTPPVDTTIAYYRRYLNDPSES